MSSGNEDTVMKRKIVPILLLLTSVCFSWGQTLLPRSEILEDWSHLCGNGSPYVYEETKMTPAPLGYRPFYLLHIGRHGSRYLNHASQYENFYQTLLRADSAGVLTPEGRVILEKTGRVVEESAGRLGQLLPRGRREHAGIMDRMISRFPEVFLPGADDSCHIEVISTSVPRVIESREAALGQLRERVPNVALTVFQGGYPANVFNADTHGRSKIYSGLKTDFSRHPAPDRVLEMLFTDAGFLSDRERGELLYDFWTVSIGALLSDTLGVDLFTHLKPEEIYPLWKQRDAYFYHVFGPSRDSLPSNRSAFVSRMIRCMDAAVAGKGHAADLHYAHDGNLFPLECQLGIVDCCTPVPDGEDTAEAVDLYFQDFAACPMGANLQVALYRRRPGGRVLVKVLMNETEVHLKGLEPKRGVYYRWEDVRSLWDWRAHNPVFDEDPVPETPRKKTALFNGRNYAGWDIWMNPESLIGPAEEVFAVKDGAMHISGKALGGCTTKKAYKDYRLTMEFRFVGEGYAKRASRAADGGLLFHCIGPEGSGSKGNWHLSFEYNTIQGRSGDCILVEHNPGYKGYLSAKAYVDELGRWDPDGILESFGKRINSRYYDPSWADRADQRSVWPEKPYGEWNRVELICKGDTAEYLLNGITVLKMFDLEPCAGRIQLQTEYHSIEYRNIFIAPV